MNERHARQRPDRGSGKQGPSGLRRIPIFWVILAALAGIWLWSASTESGADGEQIAYSTFVAEVERGNVERITNKGDRISGVFETAVSPPDAPEGADATVEQFVTYLPAYEDDRLAQLLAQSDVEVTTEPADDTTWWPILLNLLPFLVIAWIGILVIQRMRSQGQGMLSITQSKAKSYRREDVGVAFDDVAGNDNAKRELGEIVDFLKKPDRFRALGGQIPRGVLLVGPPGTGKTLLARAVAGEADVPFFHITGSDFMEMLVGVGASRVRNLFRDAKRSSPAIIFIDELDAIGRRRGAGLGGGHDEREQTLNQLLSELDGFEPREQVVVMAATNRPDVLDPALLRTGRFDRQVTADLPMLADRKAILGIHARRKPLADDVDLGQVARRTPGFSGADLANLLNEAALIAVRGGHVSIDMADIESARDKIVMGLEREGIQLDERELEILAYHEAGHATLAALLPNADPIHKVTIIPRGHAMGVTQQLPERDRYIYSRDVMQDRLAVMLGGRAAEAMIGTATSGAENDLKQATQLARKMVLDWGMSDRLGPVAFGEERAQPFLGEEIGHRREYSEETAREIDEEVSRILRDGYRRASGVLEEHREGVGRLAQALRAKEELAAERVKELLGVAAAGATPAAS